MIQPGDEILVIAKVEAIHGRDLLVNVAGHNLQISENDIAHHHGEPLDKPPSDWRPASYQTTVKDRMPYTIGQDFHLGERYDSDDMHRDYPNLNQSDA